MLARPAGCALGFFLAAASACTGTNGTGGRADGVEIPAGSRAVAVTAAGNHTCVILDPGGEARCWGALGSDAFPSAPSEPFLDIDAGQFDVCGLRAADGKAVCWGLGADGIRNVPDVAFSQISTGSGNACAVRSSDGLVQCWGRNDEGQSLPPQDRSFSTVSNARFTTCAVAAPSGEIVCWGDGEPEPWNPASQSAFSHVSNASFLSCGLRRDDSQLECWNEFLPGDSELVGAAPMEIPLRDVSVGTNHACAVLADGAVRCWGENDEGGCDAPSGVAFDRVAVGSLHSCAIRSDDGRVTCWGRNAEMQATPPAKLRAP